MLQQSNIKISDVRKELNETTTDLGSLCQSVNINRWSKWKPVPFDSFEPMTEEDMKLINYGYGNMEFRSAYTAFEYVYSNDMWSYVPPTRYFRLGDFRTYDQNTAQPFVGEITSSSSATVGENINIYLSHSINEIKDWQVINNDNTLNVGILLNRNNDIYYSPCGNILDVDNEKLTIKIDSNLPLGEYQIIPVVTNYIATNIVSISEMETNYRWIVLPTQPLTIKVIDKPQFNPFDYMNISVPDIATFEYGIDEIGEYVTNINLSFMWELLPNYPNKPMNLDLEIIYRNAINDGMTSNITLYTNSHTNCNAGYMSEEPVTYNKKIYVASIKEGELKLYLYMKCYIDQMTYENNYYEFILTQTNMRANNTNVRIRKI